MTQCKRSLTTLLHRIAFQCCHHRGRCTGNIDGGRGNATAAHAGHINTGACHQCSGDIEAIGQWQEQGERQGGGQAWNCREDGADHEACHDIEQDDRVEQ